VPAFVGGNTIQSGFRLCGCQEHRLELANTVTVPMPPAGPKELAPADSEIAQPPALWPTTMR
jgi:hypothetical protein